MTDTTQHPDTADTAARRAPSRLDMLAEAYVHDLAKLCPTAASAWGIDGYETELEDYSPEFYAAVADRNRAMLADIDELVAAAAEDPAISFDAVDQVTAAVMRDRIGLDVELYEAGEDLRCLNVLASSVQSIRDVFSFMPNDTAEDKATIIARLGQVPQALAGYQRSLEAAKEQGLVAARRQVALVAEQCQVVADPHGFFHDLQLGEDGKQAVEAAARAFGALGEYLTESLLPHAPADDAVGEERYRRFLRRYVGFPVDPYEAHTWAKQRLADIVAQQTAIAETLYGAGTDVEEAMRRLNEDPNYRLEGTTALQEWMQTVADQAVADLRDKHFTIPEAVTTIECMIDPAGTGGIFYTGPSDDFSRPGRMWWSVPPGETVFHTWQELTTVYHEGVPGHHLQCGQAVCERDNLNLWRRVACWNSGHGEGWALYAETLMAELGYHDDPATMMGVLDAARLRAARVVLDTGVHLRLATDEGGVWDYDYAWKFLRENVAMSEANLRFELHRYLGWPGQAPSYALGEQLWHKLREEAVAAGMDQRTFHSVALAEGSIPMGILRDVVLAAAAKH
ncbi:DUF885 domain-containing protein [Corynebacterium choanae]|uniref:DUF885 domain-containing protein n=1 Tax=Corynebacterium choanae TaxID=1862358 RepID=A0A3G6JDD0_9CORY|nr:DUF885 domain-containing protein [Corynebacterium choanae]AZA14670.1 hypothetical protein CCHOA_11495 [Corynebacterium choanae]